MKQLNDNKKYRFFFEEIPKHLGTDTRMEVRNPTIMRILEEKTSLVENRHSGIPTMKKEMEKLELPDPEFYQERNYFRVIFRNRNYKPGGQVSSTQSNTQNIMISKELVNKILSFCETPKTTKEIMGYLNLKSVYVDTDIINKIDDLLYEIQHLLYY